MSVMRMVLTVPRSPALGSIIRGRTMSHRSDVLSGLPGSLCPRCLGHFGAKAGGGNAPPRRQFSCSKVLLADLTSSSKSLVYKGSLTTIIHITKFISLTSSAFGIAMQPYMISQAGAFHPAVVVGVASFVCFFSYATPFLIHLVTKRYVVFLHFDPETDTFTSTTLSFFLREKHLEFKTADVAIPDLPGAFTSLLAKGTPLFFNPTDFTDVEAYRHMLGYDKPLDLKLGNRGEKPS